MTRVPAIARRPALRFLSVLLIALICPGCRPPARDGAAEMTHPAPPSAVQFVDAAEAAGIRFTHTSGASGRLYFPETVGSGCAVLDYDGDGHLDLFLVNSSRLPGYAGKGPFYPALYRNRGDGTFEDVTRQAGLAVDGYGIGCAVGDTDNDGDPDLYLTALGPNHLYRNNGDGSFTDVTRKAGVGDPRFSTSAAWIDYDRDGRLDLFVANYCRWTPESNKICFDSGGGKHMCGPTSYEGVSNTLYRNQGDGTFRDVTRQAGLYAPRGKGLGILIWDPNDDGWPDLAIANDQEPNLLYQNNRDGTFTERGVAAGIAYSLTGQARAGMGIDATDPLNDGREAVVIGNLDRQGLALFHDAGSGLFADVASTAGLFEASLPFLTFAAVFCDYDLDGWKDLLTANGHVDENATTMGQGASFQQRLQLFHNERASTGAPRFREVGESAGPGLSAQQVYRGIAVGDYDADGDPDFLVSTNRGKPLLLRNETITTGPPGAALLAPSARSWRLRRALGAFGTLLAPSARAERAKSASDSEPRARATASQERERQRAKSATAGRHPHWLQVRLRGTQSNRDGLGSRVRVTAGGMTQTVWIRSGSSFASANDACAYFGLGTAGAVDRIEVRWPTGETESFGGSPVERRLTLREGSGSRPAAARPRR